MARLLGGGVVIYALLTTIAILFLLKLAPLPIALLTVVSSSMEPSIRPGDLVLIAGKSFSTGDVVAWCSSPMYCVVHRVVNMSGGAVVTKGDANPVPDLPVPERAVKGRAVAVIPREAWASALSAATALYLWKRRREILGLFSSEISSAYAFLAAYAILSLAAIALAPALPLLEVGPRKQPLIWLSSAGIDEEGFAVIAYLSDGLEILKVDSCEVISPAGSFTCTPEQASGGLRIPIIQDALWASASLGKPLVVNLSAALTKNASLRASYTIPVPFKPLELLVINSSATIRNPNPYPVRVNTTLLWADRAGEAWRTMDRLFEIPARGSINISSEGHPYAMIETRYMLGGRVFYERKILSESP